MPHFSECCGADEYVCQKCGKVLCSQCNPPKWRTDITGSGRAGNVCPICVRKHDMKDRKNIIERLLKTRMGFLTEKELPFVIKENPVQRILVRCGNGRFICVAEQVQHFIDIIKREGSDHIRDVSIYRGA